MSTKSRQAKALRREVKREQKRYGVWTAEGLAEVHRRAAERFRRFFKPVPLSDVEKIMVDDDI